MPKCKICKAEFTKRSSTQVVCSYECGIKYAQKQQEKRDAKKKTAARVKLREFKENDKTELKIIAQKLCNRYARLRDEYENGKRCCTCGITTGKMDGGHFLPTSGYSAIRYNTNQIHQQCVNCNRYNGGRYKEYRIFMIDKNGLEYVERLEATKGQLRSYSVEYYQKYIRIIRKKIKLLEIKLDLKS